MMIDQEYLNNYFGTTWRNTCLPIESFEHSGLSLANKVSERDHVLDVGCGLNPFKGLIKNLIGIDPAFEEADYKLTLEDFVSSTNKKFDVIFCLGSINFGTREDIERQIELLSFLLTDHGKIYWRCNPGLHDHKNEEWFKEKYSPIYLTNFYQQKFANSATLISSFDSNFDYKLFKKLLYAKDSIILYAIKELCAIWL